MTTLKQSAQVAGQQISNLDPDMVITLDSHEGVQISSKTEDTITYQFLKEVDQDTEYKLNLTFVYKDQYKLVVPMSFLNKRIIPDLEMNVTWTTTEAEIKPVFGNDIFFEIKDAEGDPVTGASVKEGTVDSANGVCTGYWFKEIDEGEGKYRMVATTGPVKGDFTIKLTLTKDGLDFVIPPKSYTNPGALATFTFSPDKLASTDEGTDVTITVKRDKLGMEAQPCPGVFKLFNVSGGMSEEVPVPITVGEDGTAVVKLIPNGKVEDIVIDASFTSTECSIVQPLNVNYTIEQGAEKITVTPLNSLGDTPPISKNKSEPLKGFVDMSFVSNISGELTDAKLVSFTPSSIPEGMEGVFKNGDELIHVKDNIYSFSIYTDKGADKILVNMVIETGGKEIAVEPFEIVVIKPPVSIRMLDPVSLLPEGDGEVTFNMSLWQSSWTGKTTSNPYLISTAAVIYNLTDAVIAGDGVIVEQPVFKNVDGVPVSSFKLKAIGETGVATITGDVVLNDPKLGNQGPFSVDIPVGRSREVVSVLVSPEQVVYGSNAIVMDLKYADDQTPATGLKYYKSDYKIGTNRNQLYTGSNTPRESQTVPGRYEFNLSCGWAIGKINPIFSFSDNGLYSKVTGPVFNLLGADPIITQTDDTIVSDNAPHACKFKLEIPPQPGFGGSPFPVSGNVSLVSVDGPVTVVGGITRESSNGDFIINCQGNGTSGVGTIKLKFNCTEFLVDYTKEFEIKINVELPPPVITQFNPDYTMDLWDSKELDYTVKVNDTDVSSSVTDITCVNYDQLKDHFEFFKDDAGKWAFRSISSDLTNPIVDKASLMLKVDYEGTVTDLPLEVNLTTNPNPDPKPEFDVEFVE